MSARDRMRARERESNDDDDEPNNANTVGSVTRDRGSAGASDDGGGPTAGVGADDSDDSDGSVGPSRQTRDTRTDGDAGASFTSRPDAGGSGGSSGGSSTSPQGSDGGDGGSNNPLAPENDPRQDPENFTPADDPDEDLTFEDTGVVGGGRVPGSGTEDFADEITDAEQGLEESTPDGRGFAPEDRTISQQAEEFEQDVLDKLPDRFEEEDVRIDREQRNGQDVFTAELTKAGRFERAEQVEERVLEETAAEDPSDVRVSENDGSFEVTFTNSGRERVVADDLGVSREDISLRNGFVVPETEEGRDAIREQDSGLGGGANEATGSTSPSSGDTDPTVAPDEGAVAGGDVRLREEAESQTTVRDLPEAQRQALLNANPDLDENQTVAVNGGGTATQETADSVEEGFRSGRDIGQVLSDDPLRAVFSFGAEAREFQQDTTPVQDAGERVRENPLATALASTTTLVSATPFGSPVTAASGLGFDVDSGPLPDNEQLAQDANSAVESVIGTSPRALVLDARTRARRGVNEATQPVADASQRILSIGNEQAAESLQARRDATGAGTAAGLLIGAAAAEPTPVGEALLLLGAGGALAVRSGVNRDRPTESPSPFVGSELDIEDEGEQPSELEPGEQQPAEIGTPEGTQQPSEFETPQDPSATTSEFDVPENEAPSPLDLSFSTAVRRGRNQGRTFGPDQGPTIGDEATAPEVNEGESFAPGEGGDGGFEDPTGERSGVREPPETPEETVKEAEGLLEQAERPSVASGESGATGSGSVGLGEAFGAAFGRSVAPGETAFPGLAPLGAGRSQAAMNNAAISDTAAQATPTSGAAAAATTNNFEFSFPQQFLRPREPVSFGPFSFNFRRPRRPRQQFADDEQDSQEGQTSGRGNSVTAASTGIGAGFLQEFITARAVGPGAREPADASDSPFRLIDERQTATQATATGETRARIEAAEDLFDFDFGGGDDGLL